MWNSQLGLVRLPETQVREFLRGSFLPSPPSLGRVAASKKAIPFVDQGGRILHRVSPIAHVHGVERVRCCFSVSPA